MIMSIGIFLFLGIIIIGAPMGILIDWLANKCGLPTEDGLNPVPWALLGLVWPATLLPFLAYCLLHKKKTG